MENFDTWWEGLSITAKAFYSIGMLATIVLAVQSVLTMIGLDGLEAAEALDAEMEFGDDIDSSGIGFLSVRTIFAFLTGFGWVGAMIQNAGGALWAAILGALVAGLLLMASIFFLMRWIWSFRQSGTLDYRNAVGVEGVVYLPIPPERSGRGQIEVMIQGRLQTVPAMTSRPSRLENRSKVRVVEMLEDNTLLVIPEE